MVKVKTLSHFEYRVNGELKIFDAGKEYSFDNNIAEEMERKGLVNLVNKTKTLEPVFDNIQEDEKMLDKKHENKMFKGETSNKSTNKQKA